MMGTEAKYQAEAFFADVPPQAGYRMRKELEGEE
jgi:hypothetical protein